MAIVPNYATFILPFHNNTNSSVDTNLKGVPNTNADGYKIITDTITERNHMTNSALNRILL
ncbi:hypothetical protein [Olleya sp. Bg11-27]|uniref:hypothetical protein n=1 Tax=Olleya sp. Bg11-27 TaxID=2058135 RepID=UPI0012FE5A4D|nr:hypothetical protein [Olleya sp. Bg11-27]